MRKGLCLAAAVVILASASPVVRGAGCSDAILPDPGTSGEDSCTYVYTPFETFSYENGYLIVDWSDAYQIVEMYIIADWEIASVYEPGVLVPIMIDPQKNHYDFIGRYIVTATGEERLGLTPIRCTGSGIPGSMTQCYPSSPNSCSMTSTADNCGHSVTCDGDRGTCSDCAQSANEACCKSSTTTTVSCGEGCSTTTTTHTAKIKTCPS